VQFQRNVFAAEKFDLHWGSRDLAHEQWMGVAGIKTRTSAGENERAYKGGISISPTARSLSFSDGITIESIANRY